ncbi:hypothetical protein Smic_33010 [Streptomyces microflavus]|uniref:Uncharacterized protein n=1 Tax=Streptomyces microflavus TaxID=1919 RepID=A0A7J0CST4_STRMI|nr:hypothetical protein Smic_33010 [Streptomyces microflavus]
METPASSAISSIEAARYPRCPKVCTAASIICRSRTARGIRLLFTAPTSDFLPAPRSRPAAQARSPARSPAPGKGTAGRGGPPTQPPGGPPAPAPRRESAPGPPQEVDQGRSGRTGRAAARR